MTKIFNKLFIFLCIFLLIFVNGYAAVAQPQMVVPTINGGGHVHLISPTSVIIDTYSTTVWDTAGVAQNLTFDVCADGGLVYFTSSNCDKGHNSYNDLSGSNSYVDSSRCELRFNPSTQKVYFNWNSGNIISTSGWDLNTYSNFINSLDTSDKYDFLYPLINGQFEVYLNGTYAETYYDGPAKVSFTGSDIHSNDKINRIYNYYQDQCNNVDSRYCGDYEIKLRLEVDSSELKCDFNGNGALQPSEYSNYYQVISSKQIQPHYDSSHFRFRAEHFDSGMNIVSIQDLSSVQLTSDNKLKFNPKVYLDDGHHSIPSDAKIYADVTVTLERLDVSGDGKEFTARGDLYPQFKTLTFNGVEFEADGPTRDYIDLSSFGLLAGKYKVLELKILTTGSMQSKPYHPTLTPSDSTSQDYVNLTSYTKLFCESNDIDCDSVENPKDICENQYGSAFYLGCVEEFQSTDGQPLQYNTTAPSISCTYPKTSGRVSVTYDEVNDRLICDDLQGTYEDDYFYFNGVKTYGGADVSGNWVAYFDNPQTGVYKCKDTAWGGWGWRHSSGVMASCQFTKGGVANNGYPLNGISVFDLDLDTLKYTPDWWVAIFDAGVSYNEDKCPPSFGLTIDDGCPRINREDAEVTMDEQVTFEDLNDYKLYFDEENGQVFFNDLLIYSFADNKISDVQVDINTSCIPTNRLSQISDLIIGTTTAARTPMAVPAPVVANMTLRPINITTVEQAELAGLDQKDYLLLVENEVKALPLQDKKNLYEKIKETGDCLKPISRSDNFTVSNVLSALHYLIPVDGNQRTQDAIESIVDVSSDLTINKEILPYETATKLNTKIELDINNIPPNTTIWQVIPKESVLDVYDLYDSIKIGNADEIRIKDKDPVIGWYFEDGGDGGDLGFEINGTGEGGSTIPIEDTIYYNFGHLIVNYREFGCFDDERELFSVDNVTGSELQVGSPKKAYSVCIAHNETVMINASAGTYEQWFGVTGNKFDKDVEQIELYKELPVISYYAVEYGQYPSRSGFSCVGSLTSDDLFGDCLMNPSGRIWMYYGPDPYPPEIELGVYVPANTIDFEILITDDISGVNWSTTQYCISNDDSPCTYQAYSENERVTVSCPDVESCYKKVFVRANDIEGNLAEFNQTLDMLQVDSSCNAQCLAKPHPDRYVKSCRKVNGCEFYKLANETDSQRGSFVSNLCHYKVEGSWVNMGAGLEVQCPNGPIRSARATEDDFEVDSRICENIQTEKYPTIIDGEEVYMHIITCND